MAKFTPWFSRAVLAAALLLLALISQKFILDPVGAASASTMTLGSPLAITNMRASFGAFPLACSIFTLICLLSAHRRITGLYFVVTVIGTVLVVRLFGVVQDGTLIESLRVLGAETVLVTLSGAALYLELLASSLLARRYVAA
jgi:hypothetical protein